jgi:hypothetical protein
VYEQSKSGPRAAIPREMSSRSARVRASRERRRALGGIPPRGNNKQRMELCGLSKARPISCSVCPAFHRRQISFFSIAESPNRCPDLISHHLWRAAYQACGSLPSARHSGTFKMGGQIWVENYCSRSRFAGSMYRTRLTGLATESVPVSSKVNTTAASTNGSCAEAW